MIKQYQKDLRFKDYLTSGEHGRTGVFIKTDNSDVLLEKVSLGWAFEQTKDGFWLRSPDISIVDITEPFRIYQFGENDLINLACFKFLMNFKNKGILNNFVDNILAENVTKYIGFDYYISEGSVLEGEIRMGGSDLRIFDLKKDILRKMLVDKKFKLYLNSVEKEMGETRKILILNKEINDFDSKSIETINYINKINNIINPTKKIVALNVVDNVIDQLPDFDILLFVPTGCYRYISSFLREDTSDKIMLWEKHIDKNQYKCLKTLVKCIKGKRCLIIDKSYTGKTHNLMSKLVRKEGGFPIRLALFPKSRMAIKNSDYVLFLDKIFESRLVNTKQVGWVENCYKKVLSKNY